MPSSTQFLNIITVQAFAKHYQANEEDLLLEFKQMERMLQRMKSVGKYPQFTSGQELLNLLILSKDIAMLSTSYVV